MKKNKLLFISGLLLLMAGMASCTKDLDAVVPQDTISKDQALSDPNAARTLYHGVYGLTRSYAGTFFQLGEMRSDLWVDGLFTESVDGGLQNLYRHNISALNVPFSNWGGFYNLIYNYNNVIKIIPQTTLPAAEKNRILAEVYGLRAYVYYTMLRTWGNVPLNTEPVEAINNAAETYKRRTGVDTVMTQVKADIEESLKLFGSSNTLPTGKRVYWSRVATQILKGDVYLWSGTHMGGGTADFTTAKTALQEIRNLQGATLDLQANYADVFDPTKKTNNKEIIFAINYELQQSQMGMFGSFLVNSIQANTLSFAQAPTPTVSSVYPYVNGANRVGFNQTMLTRLTSGTPDQRINYSFKTMYSTAPPHAVRGVMLTKYIGTTAGTSQIYNNDFPIYRYADVLLLLAEAKAKLGEDPSAEINAVRLRAYGAGYTPHTNAGVTANMNAILEEYLREFIAEGKRWWALRRAGDTYVYANVNPTYFSASTAAKFLLPLSLTMLNNDPLLVQTAGY
ncbi:MAG: RagB/SusD family nutrient uptake outer membrane protein [Bacteroidetes bacterium]|uniref:RagB/SusD family nutrient uptake outer membrane protein n=1 Tax=Phnomibacter sp. TaxID=2836217 RepID=UPI002FDD5C78|nr:RagB/SusD family nutrient uptake outer membrane protein [Bacteroidota bacterium]